MLLQQGAAHGGRQGRPLLQSLSQVHQVPILSQEGYGHWGSREGGRAGLESLPGGPQRFSQHPPAPSPSGGTCPLCLRWVMRVTRLHQGFTSSQQPAVGEKQR